MEKEGKTFTLLWRDKHKNRRRTALRGRLALALLTPKKIPSLRLIGLEIRDGKSVETLYGGRAYIIRELLFPDRH